jgi:hypothetical protein
MMFLKRILKEKKAKTGVNAKAVNPYLVCEELLSDDAKFTMAILVLKYES